MYEPPSPSRRLIARSKVLGDTGWEVGAEKYRQMRWNGETPLPKPGDLTSPIHPPHHAP